MKKNSARGFTLVELIVVIAIIGVLTTIGLMSFNNVQKTARDAKRVADLHDIQVALEQYKALYGSYPAGAAGSDRECWINNDSNLEQCPLRILVDSGIMQKVPIDPGANTNPGSGVCGQAQMYVYISTNGVNSLEDGISDKGYRLGAVQETQGNNGCWENPDGSGPEKCPMWWALDQYCVTNKQ